MGWHKVYLGLGSNIDPHNSIHEGLLRLSTQFHFEDYSSMYLSQAVGFNGPPFLNMVVGFKTQKTVQSIFSVIRQVEVDMGRLSFEKSLGSRRFDADILLFDDYCGEFDGVVLPRPEILEAAYVLAPLAEVCPEELHPTSRLKYGELWNKFDKRTMSIYRLSDFMNTGAGHS